MSELIKKTLETIESNNKTIENLENIIDVMNDSRGFGAIEITAYSPGNQRRAFVSISNRDAALMIGITLVDVIKKYKLDNEPLQKRIELIEQVLSTPL